MRIWLQLKPVILQINLLYIYTLAGRGHAAKVTVTGLDLAQLARVANGTWDVSMRMERLEGACVVVDV